MGTPDVAGAVVDHQFATLVDAFAQFNSSVVDLDRLGRVQVVEDQALLRTGENHLPNLDRREPVDVEIGQQPVVVVDVDVGHVFHVGVGVAQPQAEMLRGSRPST